MQKAIVTVMGLDHPGIVAAVSQKIADLPMNILEINQVILGGYFTMMVLVDLMEMENQVDKIASDFHEWGKTQNLDIHLQHEDLFHSMNDL